MSKRGIETYVLVSPPTKHDLHHHNHPDSLFDIRHSLRLAFPTPIQQIKPVLVVGIAASLQSYNKLRVVKDRVGSHSIRV